MDKQVILFILSITANLIGCLIFLQVTDFKNFLKETRRKVDLHCEDFELHGLERKA